MEAKGFFFMSIPPDVLTQVLQHVDTQERFNGCALVSRAWHTASLAATTNISLSLGCARDLYQSRLTALSPWLSQHSGRLQELGVRAYPDGLVGPTCSLQLPFGCLSHLRSLQLRGVQVTAHQLDNQQVSSRWWDLTALTGLHLDTVRLPTWEHLAQLSAVKSLRKLQLIDLTSEQPDSSGLDKNLSAALLQLTNLTKIDLKARQCWPELSLQMRQLGNASLSALKTHQQLLELDLDGEFCITATAFQDLPLGLTSLKMERIRQAISPLNTPRIADLTDLRLLEIRSMVLIPSILSSLVKLTRLQLESDFLAGTATTAGTAALLEVLPALTCLQHLDLSASLQQAAPDIQQYSALVSSTCLTHLDLRHCKMPPESFKHIIGSSRQQLAMKSLHVWHHQSLIDLLVLTESELQCLATCWPSLQELHLLDACTAMRLTSLQKLGQLTSLAIGGIGVDQQAVQDLQEITTLQSLSLIRVADVPSSTLLRLRQQLTLLTSLSICGCSLRQPLPGLIDIFCKEPSTRHGHVWDVYERHCWDADDCFFVSQKQAHKEMKQTIEVLKQQLHEERVVHQQQMLQLQQQLQKEQSADKQQVSQLQQNLQRLQQQLPSAESPC